MGKWYNHRIHLQYRKDLKVDRGHELDKYLQHVLHIANTFPRNSMAIGCLDINDLIQAGNKGLVEAWNKVDWDRLDKSKNPQGELWSFLKIRIKFAIRQEINNFANEIKIPIRDLKKASKEMKSHEKVLVNIFPKFFGNTLATYQSNIEPWISLQLEEIIEDELSKHASYRDIAILFDLYGIGTDKLTAKITAEKHSMSEANVKKIKAKLLNKLKNETFEKKIENFYENGIPF